MGWGRPPKEPLRELAEEERSVLERIARSHSESADRVARAKIVLGVAEGSSFTSAALSVGRSCNEAVAALVARFNVEGVSALDRRHGGGAVVQYGPLEKERILREFHRTPDREQDDSDLVLDDAPEGAASSGGRITRGQHLDDPLGLT